MILLLKSPSIDGFDIDSVVAEAMAVGAVLFDGAQPEGIFPLSSVFTASPDADYPTESDVRDGTHYGYMAFEGNMTEPAETDVKSGVQYGANGTEFEGTLVAGGGGARVWSS